MVIPHQVGDPQLLVIDHLVGAHKVQRRLVVNVLSLTSHGLMRPGENTDGFPPALAAFLTT
jgi:hypothetical protein